ncbi:MAG TPA: ABC transporter permease [Pyrinomonadaceae bacterium]|jgi:ABC-type multidrug transport system permease subunit
MAKRDIINGAEAKTHAPQVRPESTEALSARVPQPDGGPKGTQRFHPLVELTKTRLREFIREPEAVFWVFVFPILLVFALGIAFRNTGPERIRIAVETDSQTTETDANALASVLSRAGNIEALPLSAAEAAQALRSGRVSLVLRATGGAPAGQATATAPGNSNEHNGLPASFNYRYDPSRPESLQARMVVDDALQRALGRADVARASEEQVTEPGARYIDFLIPGLLGMNLMGSGLWGVGFAVVNARTRKLLKRFAATPMRRSHYLLSFILSRLLFLVLEVAVVLVFARLAFGFTIRGSLAGVVFLLVLGALTFAGLGLLVASRPRTIEGVSGLMNLVMMPMWLLSGTFFSSARFPQLLQPFIKALPLTALNDSLRALMNDGLSITTSWPAVAVLLAWCVVSFILALRVFRWQ